MVRRSAVGVALALGGVTLWAQQPAPPQQPIPTFKSGVELVTVDVGVVDRQGLPMRGLTPADFTVTVAGQPRRVVSADFVDTSGRPKEASAAPGVISTNDLAALGRLFVFVVDQGTLEPGNVRYVARAASRFFGNLTFVDRSALMLLPAGPNVNFTWAHDRVQNALNKVIGQSANDSAWEFGSLTEARDIANRSLLALRTVGQRECGRGMSDPFGASSGGGPISTTPTQGGTTSGGGGGGGGTQGGGGAAGPNGWKARGWAAVALSGCGLLSGIRRDRRHACVFHSAHPYA